MNIAEKHGDSQALRECEHALTQEPATVEPLQATERIGPFRLQEEARCIDVPVDELAFLPDAAVVVDAEVATDANQPRLEIRSPVERSQRFVDPEKDVLGQIFRLVVLAHKGERDVEHPTLVSLDDGGPRRLISTQAGINQPVGGGLIG